MYVELLFFQLTALEKFSSIWADPTFYNLKWGFPAKAESFKKMTLVLWIALKRF